MEQSKLITGPPIYIESLMSLDEYRMMSKKYHTYSHRNPRDLSKFAPGEFKWRYGMGKSLSPEEIDIFNEWVKRFVNQ